MITKLWGPSFWRTMDFVAHNFPELPTEENIQDYQQFYSMIGKVLPCKYCRDSYASFIQDLPINFTNRNEVTKWVYDIHNKVNDKLGVNYEISYQDYCDRYNKFRAICSDKNKTCLKTQTNNAYKTFKCVQAPIIPKNLADKFIPLARQRGIKVLTGIDVKSRGRNKVCYKLLFKLRSKRIEPIEDREISDYELKLIMLRCSSVHIQDLIEFSNKYL